MTERSVLAYDIWKTSQEKFDYFILGVISAFCAYASQSIVFNKIGWNSSTYELISLLLVLLAGVFAFLRLSAGIQVHAFSHKSLSLSERKGQLVTNNNGQSIINEKTGEIFTPKQIQSELNSLSKSIPQYKVLISKQREKTIIFYKLRNFFLLIGFLLMLGAKVYSAYE